MRRWEKLEIACALIAPAIRTIILALIVGLGVGLGMVWVIAALAWLTPPS